MEQKNLGQINPVIGIDLTTFEELQRQHPRSAITVLRRHLDGSDSKFWNHFGCVPHDWNGETIFYHFEMKRNNK